MYHRQFKLFISFAVFLQCSQIQHVSIILAFLQWLHDNDLAQETIANYVSAIKHSFIMFNLNHNVLQHPKIPLLLRSFSINRPLKVKHKGIITLQLLQQLIHACQSLQYPTLFKAIFLLAYFSFRRISNFAPHSSSTFDPTRHLQLGDIVWGDPGAHVILKWTKTLQSR